MSINTVAVSPAELGRLGEALACTYIEQCLGWTVVDRNVRTRYGEIDIVARDEDTFRFVEVKARRGHRMGTPLEAVSHMKLRRLVQQVKQYFYRSHVCMDATDVSLDVIGLTFHQGMLATLHHVRISADSL